MSLYIPICWAPHMSTVPNQLYTLFFLFTHIAVLDKYHQCYYFLYYNVYSGVLNTFIDSSEYKFPHDYVDLVLCIHTLMIVSC